MFLICIEQTSYRYLTGKICKDSKYCRRNKSAGVRNIFLLPTPKAPLLLPPKKTAERRGKGKCKLQEKHHYETHKQWTPFDTACKDRSTSKLKFISLHTHKATMKTWETTETIWSLQSFHQHR